MNTRPSRDNVRYTEFTPATIVYDIELDAFLVARVDVPSSIRCHHRALIVAVTTTDLAVNSLTIQDAIDLGRRLLGRLLAQHRGVVDSLGASSIWIFDLAGVRLR